MRTVLLPSGITSDWLPDQGRRLGAQVLRGAPRVLPGRGRWGVLGLAAGFRVARSLISWPRPELLAQVTWRGTSHLIRASSVPPPTTGIPLRRLRGLWRGLLSFPLLYGAVVISHGTRVLRAGSLRTGNTQFCITCFQNCPVVGPAGGQESAWRQVPCTSHSKTADCAATALREREAALVFYRYCFRKPISGMFVFYFSGVFVT